ncbi:MAG: ECF-type sigma factor [Planctomycetes bacterium]|nr:ECF-type sigma factor [Planctomycetota bacterium]
MPPTHVPMESAWKNVDDPELLDALYAELKSIARAQLRGERPGHTLQTTALVHEAYLKLARTRRYRWGSRAEFVAMASRAVRQVLVDHARRKKRVRRGGGADPVPLDGREIALSAPSVDVLDLDEALTELARLNERQARIVELRFFGGLTAAEAAAATGVSVRTADSDWEMARWWLRRRLKSASA